MKRLARSIAVGGLATLVDQAALFAFIVLLGFSPRAASVPALLLAATAQFAGQRHLAFRASGDPFRQALHFTGVHAITLLLNAVLFDVALRFAGAYVPYWALRLLIGNAVYLAWSYPMLRRVFAIRPAREEASDRSSPHEMPKGRCR